MKSELPAGLVELLEEDPTRKDLENLGGLVRQLRAAPQIQPPPKLRRSILAALDQEIHQMVPWSTRLWAVLRLAAVVGAGMVLAAGYLGWSGFGVELSPPPGPLASHFPEAEAPRIQILENSSSTSPNRTGEALQPGRRLLLAAGESLRLDWKGQGDLVLEGPGEFVLRSHSVELEKGSLESEIDPDDRLGFRVRTPQIEVLVVGTRFRVEHSPEAGSRVRVREGKVRVLRLRDGSTEILTPESKPIWPASVATPEPQAPVAVAPAPPEAPADLPAEHSHPPLPEPTSPPAATVVDGF